jgi:hypothetical protein
MAVHCTDDAGQPSVDKLADSFSIGQGESAFDAARNIVGDAYVGS